MRLNKKSISKVGLLDVLRRRRRTLSQFLLENGIVTYELLNARCESMGVTPPTPQEFLNATGGVVPQISSPTEGVVIIEVEVKYPVSEATGRSLSQSEEELASLLNQPPDEDVLTISDAEATLTVPMEDIRKRKKKAI